MAIAHRPNSPFFAGNGSVGGPLTLDRTTDPLASAQAGDWIWVAVMKRGNAAPTVIATGGQTWVSETAVNTATTGFARLFHCRFNGTWSADPQFGVAGTDPHCLFYSVLSGVANTNVDGVATSGLDQADGGAAYTAPSSPFDVTRAGQTATVANCMAWAFFGSVDDNAWAVQTAGWTDHSAIQNTAGSDASASLAEKLVTGASGSVVNRQTANGGDAGVALFWMARPDAVDVRVPYVNRMRQLLAH